MSLLFSFILGTEHNRTFQTGGGSEGREYSRGRDMKECTDEEWFVRSVRVEYRNVNESRDELYERRVFKRTE